MIGPTRLCPQGIGLILVDLDDTVLIDGTKMTERVIDTIALARERGVMTCVSSGRALHMVPKRLRGPETMDYLICANGAVVYDTIDGMLRERLIPRERALAVMDAVEPLGAGWNAFVDGKSYFEWRSLSYLVTGRRQPLGGAGRLSGEGMRHAIRTGGGRSYRGTGPRQPLGGSDRLSGSDMRHALHTGAALHTKATMLRLRRAARFAKRIVQHDDSMRQVFDIRPYIEAAEGDLLKMGCTLSSPKACERAIDILEHMGDFEIARMSTTELEITAKGATKGNAATWLMERLGIEPACAVAFGDSENDATLAEVCGTFVAMGNADRRVRELADDVCETVYDDGVARWLERAMAEADGASNV